MIYFAQEQKLRGRIKIGFTMRPIEQRLLEIQSMTYFPVELIATQEGYRGAERRLHRRFHHARVAGEWFKPVDELVEYCKEIGISMAKENKIEGRKARTITMSDEDWAKLTKYAAEQGRSRSQMLCHLLRQELAKAGA